jgi:hypothetical protein
MKISFLTKPIIAILFTESNGKNMIENVSNGAGERAYPFDKPQLYSLNKLKV